MPRLRHLLFDKGVLLCSPGPQNANLQTLSGEIDFRFTQEALQIIPNLKTLGISYRCETHEELSCYCLDNLVHLYQLENFKRVISSSRKNVPLPQNLTFPPNLKKLSLGCCTVSWENMLLVGSLPNLEVLTLKEVAFEITAWKTKEGEFSRLKFLLVERNFFEFWEAKEAHFPSLQYLCLRHCRKLNCIPSGIGEIPTLQLILLYECSLSAVTSANSILEEQQELGNYDLGVHVYSCLNGYKASQGVSNPKIYTAHKTQIKHFKLRKYMDWDEEDDM